MDSRSPHEICRQILINRKKTLLTSEEIKEKQINKGIPFEEYKDERGVFNLDHECMSDLSRFVKAQETDQHSIFTMIM